MNQKPGSIKQLVLAMIISVTAAVSLSGCAWFQGHHTDPNADSNDHMNDYDHDHAPLEHNGDRHDDSNMNDPNQWAVPTH